MFDAVDLERIATMQTTVYAKDWSGLAGATLPEWRGRGLYKATVAYRAKLALKRGFPLLEVEATDHSRPILQRLGFTAVTTTRSYVWTPVETD